MKQALLAVAIIGLLVRVYFVYYGAAMPFAKKGASSPLNVEQLRRNMQTGAVDAGEKIPGGHPPVPTPTGSAAAAIETERQEIDGALKGMHVTTIMPGQPGLFIVDKQEYSEGESLPLPKGRKARVVAVRDDGVQLACDNMAFRLDPPAAPDLAALRKKK